MRHTFVAALAAGMLLIPGDGHAQLQQPLRTMCQTWAMDFCVSIRTWEIGFQEGREPTPENPRGTGELRFTYEIFGNAVPTGAEFFIGWMVTPFQAGCCTQAFTRNAAIMGPDEYEFADATGPIEEFSAESLDPHFAEFFIPIRRASNFEFVGGCSIGTRDDPDGRAGGSILPQCVEISVAEPATWLLLLTGLVALGWVARRSRAGEST